MHKKYMREPGPQYKAEDIKTGQYCGGFFLIILSKLNPSGQLKNSKFQFNIFLPKEKLFLCNFIHQNIFSMKNC